MKDHLIFETLAKMPPFSYNVTNSNLHQKGARKEAPKNTITAKGRVVNKTKVEAQFAGKNLTIVGGMGLFHRFVKKLGVEDALGQSIELSPQARVKYKRG